METYLKLNNISKRYGHIQAVKNLSFSIEKGHVYGILGPNGSGKSTTLGMVLNVINPTHGNYEWFGGMATTEALKQIGAIIEHPNFYPYMTAEQNLKLVCKIKSISPAKVDEKLNIVGLLERKKDKFKTFSLGMKQRLAIASALLNDPKVLILDEPTNGLDPQGIHQIRSIIQNIAQTGTTILLASHLLDEVEKICSHVVIIRKGEMLYSGRVDALNATHGFFELKADGQTEALQRMLTAHPNFKNVRFDTDTQLFTATLNSPINAQQFNKEIFEKGIALSHLVHRKESLESRFLNLTNSSKV